MADKFPYYIYPDVMALKEGTLTDKGELALARRRVAANVGDMQTLRILLGVDPEEFAHFYPDMMKASLSTDDTISSFLSHFGKEDAPMPQAAAAIPEPVVAPEINPATEQKPVAKAPKTMADAQLLIKKRNYEGALEIIMQLSLNNPKKSIYFADQIRFLRKLILNQSKQNNI